MNGCTDGPIGFVDSYKDGGPSGTGSNTVAAPIFSPAAGTYSTDQSVSIIAIPADAIIKKTRTKVIQDLIIIELY